MPTLPSTNDQATFAALVMDRFRQKGWTGPITYLADDFSLDLGPKAGKAFLGNLYQDWLDAEEANKTPTIDKLVSTTLLTVRLADKPLAYEEAAPDLLPTVRSRAYIENMWLGFDPAGKDGKDATFQLPNRRLTDDLSVVVAIDLPDALGFVSQTHLKDWGKTFDDLYTAAFANLRRKAQPHLEAMQQPGLFTVEGLGFFQPSLLLLPDAVKGADIKGDPVAVPVLRNCVILAGTRDDKALAALARAAEGIYANESRPISLMPLLLKGGAWVSYDAPEGQLPVLDRLRRKARVAEYQDQKGLLNGFFDKSGRQALAADIEAIDIGNGRVLSFTTLSTGVEMLLPQAQVVVIAPPDMQAPFARRWEDVVAVFGLPETEPHIWPVRYRFPATMDARKVAALKALPDAPDFPKIGEG